MDFNQSNNQASREALPGRGWGEAGRRTYAIKKANNNFVYTFVPEYAQSILGFVNFIFQAH